MMAPAVVATPPPINPSQSFIRLEAPDGSTLWESNPGPQTAVLHRRETEICFGGARGGGKTAAGIIWLLLGNWALPNDDPYRWTYINDRNYKALVLRVNAVDLKEWIDEAKKIYEPLGAKFTGNPVVIEFPSGAKIYTNHLDSEDAFEKYKGWSLWKILVEELTLIKFQRSYLRLLGSLRAFNSNGKANPQIFSTTNPDGIGTAWVRNRFVDVPVTGGGTVPWGRTMRDPITKLTRIFIPAKVGDNPYAQNDPNYMGMLLSQDPATQEAWIHGIWGSMAGTFFREFRNNLLIGPRPNEPAWASHVVYPVELKPWWFRFGGADWGYKHYASAHKVCLNQSDGRFHVYDELVVNQVGSFEWGTRLANWWSRDLEMLPDHKVTIHLSPDAFDKSDATNTIAQQIQAGIIAHLGPGSAFIMARNDDEKMLAQRDPDAAERLYAQRRMGESAGICINIARANHNRPMGAAFIRDLMRWVPAVAESKPDLDYAKALYDKKGLVAYTDYLARFKDADKPEILPKLQIWQRQGPMGQGCPRLIRCIPSLQHDPKRPEDVFKIDAEDGNAGDDEYDSFRYALMAAKNLKKIMPKAYWVDEMTNQYSAGIEDINIIAQVRRTQSALYDQQHSNQGGGGATFARAGSSRHRVQ